MKYISIRTLTLTVATAAFLGLACGNSASADPSLTIRIGAQAPPPQQEDHQWAKPYRTAVWIPGHNEWTGGSYAWVAGYYAYPPHRHSHWVAARYPHNQEGYSYIPGHWSS